MVLLLLQAHKTNKQEDVFQEDTKCKISSIMSLVYLIQTVDKERVAFCVNTALLLDRQGPARPQGSHRATR